jgi:TRAP-type C4-dicarboxylate transport system substrate-binding protein
MRIHARYLSAAAAAVALGLSASTAMAKDLVFATFVPPTHGIVVHALNPMIAELNKATNGSVAFTLKPGAQLFGAKESISSTGGGIADATTGIPSYTPSMLPHMNIIAELQMFMSDGRVGGAAAMDTLFNDCPECQNDYKKVGAILLSGYATSGNTLFCNKKVDNLAAAKGTKARTTGATGRWAKAMGATPVRMGIPDMPGALERGQIDCVVGPVAWIKSYGLMDSIKSVLDFPMGAYPAAHLVIMNHDSWKARTTDEKKIMLRHFARGMARAIVGGYLEVDEGARAAVRAKGIPIYQGGQEFADLMQRHLKDEIETISAQAAKRRVKDPKKIIDAYLRNVDKWKGILAKAGPGATAYDQALWDNLYSKLDPEKL